MTNTQSTDMQNTVDVHLQRNAGRHDRPTWRVPRHTANTGRGTEGKTFAAKTFAATRASQRHGRLKRRLKTINKCITKRSMRPLATAVLVCIIICNFTALKTCRRIAMDAAYAVVRAESKRGRSERERKATQPAALSV